MIYNNRPYDADIAKKFSTVLNFQRDSKEKWYNNVLAPMIAGCFNFFKMNDRGVHGNFALIENFYPEKKDCLTVGFSQYYLMFQHMRCARIIAIDMDWRILKMHYDLGMQVRKEPPEKDLVLLIKSLDFAWVAHFDRPPVRREIMNSEHAFCMDTELPYCKSAFEYYINHPQRPTIELNLAFLHDAILVPNSSKLSVVFASNALDWEYTSRSQFQKLLSLAEKYLQPESKIAIIYQAGDSEDIAIYELAKDSEGNFSSSIRCRDDIRWSARYKKHLRDKPIQTWFDQLFEAKQLKSLPACHAEKTKRYLGNSTKKT